METDIYHDCGHRRRNTDNRRKQKSTNADTPQMTMINDNEVARLREENADLKQWLDERYKALSEADDEVARLRELLNRAIAIARTLRKLAFIDSEDYCDWHFEDRTKAANDFANLCKEVNRLATVPEEPVIQDSRITEPFSTPTDLKQQNKENTPSLNEWRELGEDEVIGADDEYNPASLGEWIKVPHGWIGEKCPHHSIVPLEQGDMIVHQCTSCGKKLNKFPKPKGDVIEKSALEMLSHENVFTCLRYLRDEIQKLKEAK